MIRVGGARVRIYLDSCCYNRPYDDQFQPRVASETQAILYIQNQIMTGRIELATSYVLRYEISKSPFPTRMLHTQNFIRHHSHVYVGTNSSDMVESYAKEIMKTGVKLYDAYHVACAIVAQCDYFLSTDDRLLKYRSSKILLLNPIAWIDISEEGNKL